MKINMKVLDRPTLLKLNESSRQGKRKQNLTEEQLNANLQEQYIVNFHFNHKWGDNEDIRLSVILKPGALSAWLDVSIDEYNALAEVEMGEKDWEAAVCVGIPHWSE